MCVSSTGFSKFFLDKPLSEAPGNLRMRQAASYASTVTLSSGRYVSLFWRETVNIFRVFGDEASDRLVNSQTRRKTKDAILSTSASGDGVINERSRRMSAKLGHSPVLLLGSYETSLSTTQTRVFGLMGLSKTSSAPAANASSVISLLVVNITTPVILRCSNDLINLTS